MNRYDFFHEAANDATGNESLALPFLTDQGGVVGGMESSVLMQEAATSPTAAQTLRTLTMGNGQDEQSSKMPMFVRTQEGQLELFLDSNINLADPKVVNLLCRILDQQGPEDTITLHLGVMMCGAVAMGIGAILSSMARCCGKIITIAHGRCGFPESMIWCYGKERYIGDYGELTFEGEFTFVDEPSLRSYFRTFREKLREIGLLTEEQLVAVFEKNQMAFVYPQQSV